MKCTLVMVAAVVLGACSPPPGDGDGGSGGAGGSGSGGAGGGGAVACDLVVDRTFVSVEELEVGMGPDGVVLGHWSVSFTSDSFQWHHSDVGESGSYSCANGQLSGSTGGARSLEGHFEPGSGTLVWDGVEYR